MNCRCQGLSVVCSGGNGLHPGITSGFGLRSVRHTTWSLWNWGWERLERSWCHKKELCYIVEDVGQRRTRWWYLTYLSCRKFRHASPFHVVAFNIGNYAISTYLRYILKSRYSNLLSELYPFFVKLSCAVIMYYSLFLRVEYKRWKKRSYNGFMSARVVKSCIALFSFVQLASSDFFLILFV